MKTISLIKAFSLATLIFFTSCQDNDQEEPNEILCEISFESTLIENDSENEADYVFEATPLESESNVVYSWMIDGINIDETSNVLNHVFIENGTYTVCVLSETPECPNAVRSCQDIIVDSLPETTDGCPVISFEVVVENNEYIFIASSDIELDTRYSWFVNGEFINNDITLENSNSFTYTFPENGTYTVCASIETPECPLGVEYCNTIDVSNVE